MPEIKTSDNLHNFDYYQVGGYSDPFSKHFTFIPFPPRMFSIQVTQFLSVSFSEPPKRGLIH